MKLNKIVTQIFFSFLWFVELWYRVINGIINWVSVKTWIYAVWLEKFKQLICVFQVTWNFI